MKMTAAKIVTTDQEKAWDNFVTKNDGSIYHLYVWSKICSQSFGYKSQYKAHFEEKKIVGIYPFLIRGKIFKKTCTMPFSDGIGPLGKFQLDQSVVQFFVGQSTVEGKKLDPSHSLFVLPLGKSYEELFSSAYHHKTRNMVRKAQKEGLVTRLVLVDNSSVEDFYFLYLKTMRKLGTVAIPKKFFQSVSQQLGTRNFLSVCYLQNKPASFLWLFDFNKKTYVWANGSEESLLSTGANYAVYDAAIKHAISLGHKEIVLGASDKDSPQAFFKRRWGAEEKPVYFLTHKQAPQETHQGDNSLQRVLKHFPLSLYEKGCTFAYWLF